MTNHAVYPKLIILSYWNTPSGMDLYLCEGSDPKWLVISVEHIRVDTAAEACYALLKGVASWIS